MGRGSRYPRQLPGKRLADASLSRARRSVLTVGIALVAGLRRGGALPGVIVAGLAVCLLAGNEVHVTRQRAAERRVIDTGSGFRWLGGFTDIEVQDSQVIAVRIKRTSKFSAGVVRRFEAWTAESDKPMCMTNRISVDGEDPLAALIARVTEDLKQRTAASLASGAMLEGEGWRLAAMQLSITRGRLVDTLPFSEIDKVGIFDGKICIWQRGRDEPSAKIRPDSKNASVLALLLTEWIEHQREASAGQPEQTPGSSGLGRLLFERRMIDSSLNNVRFALHLGLAGSVILLFGHHFAPVCAIALAETALNVIFGRCFLRCYEFGLSRRRRGNEFRLSYNEITEMTYAASPVEFFGAISEANGA